MGRTLNKEQFETLCKQIGMKLSLQDRGVHVAGVFENNDSDTVIGWAVLDSDNNVVKKYNSIEDLFNEYGK
jgi:hypothetical protein